MINNNNELINNINFFCKICNQNILGNELNKHIKKCFYYNINKYKSDVNGINSLINYYNFNNYDNKLFNIILTKLQNDVAINKLIIDNYYKNYSISYIFDKYNYIITNITNNNSFYEDYNYIINLTENINYFYNNDIKNIEYLLINYENNLYLNKLNNNIKILHINYKNSNLFKNYFLDYDDNNKNKILHFTNINIIDFIKNSLELNDKSIIILLFFFIFIAKKNDKLPLKTKLDLKYLDDKEKKLLNSLTDNNFLINIID